MAQPLLNAELADAVLGTHYFTARSASRIEVVASSRRPNSTLFQVRVDLAPAPRLFWVKVNPAGSIGSCEAEYRFLKLACVTFGPTAELTVPVPVAYLPDWDALVTEHLEGVQLHRLVKKELNRFRAPFVDSSDIECHFRRCGTWLAALHAQSLPNDDQFDPILVRDYVDVRLAHLETRGSIDQAFRGRVIAYLDSLSERLAPEALVRVKTHGDFVPYNVIATPERIGVLDPDVGGYFARLDNYCSRYEDVVHFHRFTQTMSGTGMIPSGVCRRLAGTFLTSYAAASGTHLSEGTAAFRAFRLKYDVLAIGRGRRHSFMRRAASRHFRIRALRQSLDQAYRE